ncbi:MAG: hypothetical protein M0Z60_12735, partial [Nitrospiraceae bacterium]|nr:hypothetical protein [Nitrospiraceae bacterium]
IEPLRTRREDIPPLAQHFLEKYRRELGKDVTHISAEAMKLLLFHAWPGNARQLENAIHRAVILCQGKTIRPEHLSSIEVPQEEEVPRTMAELKEKKKNLRLKSVEDIEKNFLIEALRRNNMNVSRASSDVGMQRTNFHALMKKYHIILKPANPE